MRKREDIICGSARPAVELWKGYPERACKREVFCLYCNGDKGEMCSGEPIILQGGGRVTIEPGARRASRPECQEAIIREIATANGGVPDNFFVDPIVGRLPGIERDEQPPTRLFWKTPI